MGNGFYSKVTVGGQDECWLWLASLDRHGYGRYWDGENKRIVGAHRFAFYLANGYLPEMVLHSCDVRHCCNPKHLFAGDHQANMDDMVQKGRAKAGPGCGVKISDEDVVVIRSMAGTGKEIGEQFGICQQHVWKIKNYERRQT